MAEDEDTKKLLRKVHESCIRTEEQMKNVVSVVKTNTDDIAENTKFRQNVSGWARISGYVGGIGGGGFGVVQLLDVIKAKFGG